MSKPAFAIVVDRATNDQLNAVHELVKKNANGWWHHFTNLWIVLGKGAQEWRDIVKPGLQGSRASVVVIMIAPPDGTSRWSMFATAVKTKAKWLHDNLKSTEDA